jgi:hypothetical protein
MRHAVWRGAGWGDFASFVLEKLKRGLQKDNSVSQRAELWKFSAGLSVAYLDLRKKGHPLAQRDLH